MQFRGGMNELARQAARFKRKIDQIEAEMKDREYTVGTAGEKVRVTATCGGKVTRVEVDPEFLGSEGLSLVCDAIVAASNAALETASKAKDDEIKKVTSGLQVPGMGG